MPRVLDPFWFVVIAVAGWMNQRQLQIIDYLREENRVLREQLGDKRLRLNDDQRRRLAAKAKGLGRKILAEVVTIITPETLLAYGRKPHTPHRRQRGPVRVVRWPTPASAPANRRTCHRVPPESPSCCAPRARSVRVAAFPETAAASRLPNPHSRCAAGSSGVARTTSNFVRVR